LQAVIGDDPFDAALANGMALLADLLGDDGGGGIWIEEATADDQADDLIGAAVMGFRSASFQEQALGAFLAKVSQELVITLAGEIIFLSSLGRPEAFALALDEHSEAAADLVIIGDEEDACGTGEAELFFRERNLHGGKLGEGGEVCQIKYGGILRNRF
jgi:hypothetical protein